MDKTNETVIDTNNLNTVIVFGPEKNPAAGTNKTNKRSHSRL